MGTDVIARSWGKRHIALNKVMEGVTLLRAKSRLPLGDPTYSLCMPYQLQIAMTTRCNLACGYCENPLMVKAGMSSDMDFDKYCQLIDQLAGVRILSLLGIGEPLLHPRFPEMVAYAAKKNWGWHISTTSNGMLLTDELGDKLIDAGLNEMRISIDGPDKDYVEKMRKGAKFDKIIDNFRRFRRKTGMRMAMNVVMSSINLDSLQGLIPFATDLGVNHLQIMTLKPWTGVDLGQNDFTLFHDIDQRQLDTIRELQAEAKQAGLEFDVSYEPFYGNFCADPWNKPYINPDGALAPCCTWTTNYLDNVFDVGFKKAWNGPRIRHLRQVMLKGFPGSFCYQNCRLVRQTKEEAVSQSLAVAAAKSPLVQLAEPSQR
jgi:MoaA/NifB/PqqE/SkfB family radical SAM enzyme